MADSTSTVAPGFEGYIGDMLSTGWGLSKLPYQPYTGERFAGVPDTLKNAFTGLGALPGYTPGQMSTGLGPVGSVQDYMNPFIQNVVNIQAREARRQSEIDGQADQAKFAQAGAFGSSRQGVVEAERQRNLQTQIGDIQAKGLMAAFDAAQKQRLGEATLGLEGQRLGELSRQFGAGQDLRGLEAQMKAGTLERGIAQEPLDFGYKEFQESLNQPYKSLSTMQSLLTGLPVTARPYEPGASSFGAGLQGGLGGLALYNLLFGKGQ